MQSIIKQALSHRRENPPSAGEHLVIDAVLEVNDDDPGIEVADMVTILIAGFHTTGLSE